MELSTSQYHLLKRLRRKDLDLSSCSIDEKEDITFLGRIGLVQYSEICEDDNPRVILQSFAHIRPKGKAEYDAYIRARNRWFIPLFVSIAALFLSIVTLAIELCPLLTCLLTYPTL